MATARNSRVLRTIPFIMAVCLFSIPAQAQYGGGTGEPNDPYLIYTASQMNAIGFEPNDWDKHFKLMADIDLAGYTGRARLPLFNIIGYFISGDDNKPFTGVFDGNGRKISNFNYTSKGVDNIGIFGYVDDPNAQIKDLGLINPNIDIDIDREAEIPVGSKYVGSLAGYFRSGTITNCYVQGGSVSGQGIVGGLVGENNRGTISNCYSFSSISGTNDVGGLVGNNYGTIIDCYSTGGVFGIWTIGGLVGYNGIGIIVNSYSNAEVSGNQDVGGLVGLNRSIISNCFATAGVTGTGGGSIGGLVGRNHETITDCYSTGSVTGFSVVGGLVGKNGRGTITNCYAAGRVKCYLLDPVAGCQQGGLIGLNDVDTVYNSFWDIQTSGQSTSAGGAGKTTDQMQTESTFISWWCGSFWMIDERVDYPRLSWENKHGEPISKQLSDFVAGSGEPNDPYLIDTAEQLNMVGLFWCDWDKHFKLMSDIDLSDYTRTDFNIIGGNARSFTGVFDGNNHTISNFTYTSTGRDNIGLFGHVDQPAMIKDLGLVDPNVDAGEGTRVGSLVGRIWNGTITNCYAEGGSVSSSSVLSYIGGLVGINGVEMSSDATITNCYATVSVMGNRYVGGLVGYNSDTITNCYATGDVTGDSVVGGLVGDNSSIDEGGCIIANCYATGSVTGQTQIGGLVGCNGFGPGTFGIFPGEIFNCYSTGSVSGTDEVGGLLGSNSGDITMSYSTDTVSGETEVGGLVGRNLKGSITTSYSSGTVTGTSWYVGGLVGHNSDSSITSCYSSASVSGIYSIGGLVGTNSVGTIINCYAKGSVSLKYMMFAGGLVGQNHGGIIKNCYSVGYVQGPREVGGLIGSVTQNGTVITSFWDTQTSGQANSAGGIPFQTDLMQTTSTFLEAGWDFVDETENGTEDIWFIPENDYPNLTWELLE